MGTERSFWEIQPDFCSQSPLNTVTIESSSNSQLRIRVISRTVQNRHKQRSCVKVLSLAATLRLFSIYGVADISHGKVIKLIIYSGTSITKCRGLDIVVGAAIRYEMNGSRSEPPWWQEIFSSTYPFRQALGPTQPFLQRVRPKSGTEQPISCRDNEWVEPYLYTHSASYGMVWGHLYLYLHNKKLQKKGSSVDASDLYSGCARFHTQLHHLLS